MEVHRKPFASFKTNIKRKQIQNLLDYSKNDPLIKKFTNDSIRFSSIKNFRTWKSDKKIFTLVDEKETLLGIIWFSKKQKFTKIPFNFAVRIYPPIRGGGFAKYFMDTAFKRFRNTKMYRDSKYKGFWLSTKMSNKLAIKLYTKFGFRSFKSDLENKIMVYEC